jgi:Uncharacterized protein conserved in bacteria (DUF2171)
MTDPVSWFVIEPGWEVVAADGTPVGKVHEVVGDSGEDIFNGLSVTTGLLKPNRYVPAERVRGIIDGRVELDLSPDAIESLDAYEDPPPSRQIRGD